MTSTSLYESKEQCFLAAFDAVRDHLAEVISAAAAAEPDWPHQVIAALRDEPRVLRRRTRPRPPLPARVGQRHADDRDPLPRGRPRRRPRLSPAAAPELADPDSLLPETESSIIGGAVSLATRSIIAGETEKLPDLLPDLTEFTLSPYLGLDRALELAAETRAA